VRDVPVQQNTPKPTFEAAQATPRGDIRLAWCGQCGLVTNTAFDPALEIYTADYNNSQTYSGVFSQYVHDLAVMLVEQYGLRQKRIVEIGCGAGDFLKKLCELGDNNGWGFDPSYTGPLMALNGRIRFIKDFFGPRYAGYTGDLYLARHLIEHIHDLDALMRGVRSAVGSSQAVVFFETPDVRWILKNVTFWDIFYEHCSLFSPASLTHLFTRYGFTVRRSSLVFGEQYQWLEAAAAANAGLPPAGLDSGHDIGELARHFAREADKKIADYQRQLQQPGIRSAVWGAGAKGVTFLNTLKPALEVLPVVVDVNPGKQGRYIPGTGQLVIAPEQLPGYQPDTIFIMNPNYADEIRSTVSHLGLNAAVSIVE
jgi:SAM-dependent methyltransferase